MRKISIYFETNIESILLCSMKIDKLIDCLENRIIHVQLIDKGCKPKLPKTQNHPEHKHDYKTVAETKHMLQICTHFDHSTISNMLCSPKEKMFH